jgi:hypothetical protein
MKKVSVMATFPGREEILAETVGSIAAQVDVLHLVFNEYAAAGLKAPRLPKNVTAVFPKDDLKDTGKFFVSVEEDDYVFLCDDDIVYPPDYTAALMAKYGRFEHLNPIIGVHGVTYVDVFDGNPASRVVHVFAQALKRDCFVNQLGTGTTLCRGRQMPTFEFMKTSARFVDLRFARHCQRNEYPRICIAREGRWMNELKAGPSIFESFTTNWATEIVRECQEIAGFRFLPRDDLLAA